MADGTSRVGSGAPQRKRWVLTALIMGVVAFFALAATPASGSGLGNLTKDDLVRAGFSCEFHNISGGMVICTKGTVTYVCDKSGNGCVEAPLPSSNLKADDLKKDGFICAFHNVSGGMVICTKGTVTYICDKFGDKCAEAPFGGRGILATRSA